MSAITLCATVALLLVMGIAALSKSRSRVAFGEFSDSFAQFGIKLQRQQRLAALAVVTAEMLAVTVLAIPGQTALTRLGPTVVLMTGFSLAVSVAASRKPAFTCHCFGSSSTTRVGVHLAVNGGLIALGVAGILIPGHLALSAGAQVLAVGVGLIFGVAALAAPPVLEALAPGGAISAATRH